MLHPRGPPGDRKGYEAAQQNDGIWDATGIYLYSEMEKSFDICLCVFLDDAMRLNGKMKVGSCKHRRGANIPSTFVGLNVNAGMVGLPKSDSNLQIVSSQAVPADEVGPHEGLQFFGYRRPE